MGMKCLRISRQRVNEIIIWICWIWICKRRSNINNFSRPRLPKTTRCSSPFHRAWKLQKHTNQKKTKRANHDLKEKWEERQLVFYDSRKSRLFWLFVHRQRKKAKKVWEKRSEKRRKTKKIQILKEQLFSLISLFCLLFLHKNTKTSYLLNILLPFARGLYI